MRLLPGMRRLGALLLIQLLALPPAFADPCGMVTPFPLTQGNPELRRVGEQITFAFFSNGIEDLVLRPGFEGEVADFGMLIPFPSPPEIRKVPDTIFTHLANAVEPPEIVIDLRPRPESESMRKSAGYSMPMARDQLALGFVNVIREEAVGMYQVAVLEASDPRALALWMEAHGYVYPQGMDPVCAEYITAEWCFVAVKANIGNQAGVAPKPGMRGVSPDRPTGSTFDGAVQAMGFRFRADELVIPMRLSAFNPGELKNRVYILSDTPCRLAQIGPELVERQIPGARLRHNITDPLPLRVIGGTIEDARDQGYLDLPQYDRDPAPKNGFARDLLASNLLAVKENRLLHAFETREKELLKIGERLGLRGPEVDGQIRGVLSAEQREVEGDILAALDGMTLTVIEGDFPRDVIAKQNLTIVAFDEVMKKNVETGALPTPSRGSGTLALALLGLVVVAGVGTRGRGGRGAGAALLAVLLLPGLVIADSPRPFDGTVLAAIDRLADAATSEAAAGELVALGPRAVPDLIGEAVEGGDLARRGWAVVCLAEIGHRSAVDSLVRLRDADGEPELLQLWASAALTKIRGAEEIRERLRAAQSDPEAIPELTTLLLGLRGAAVRPLLEVALTSTAIAERQQAMSLLGSLDLRLRGGVVRRSLEEALRYTPERAATGVPWAGGPLFLPGYAWTPEEARRVSLDLCCWLADRERSGDSGSIPPLLNNLRDLSWRTSVGFQHLGGAVYWTKAFVAHAGLDAASIHSETDPATLILVLQLLRNQQ